MTEAHDTANGVYDTFMAEARRQPWRTTMSSDLPGEDGNKFFSIETLRSIIWFLARATHSEMASIRLKE